MIRNDEDAGSVLMALPADPFKAVRIIEGQLEDAIAWADVLPGDDAAVIYNSLNDARESLPRVKSIVQRQKS